MDDDELFEMEGLGGEAHQIEAPPSEDELNEDKAHEKTSVERSALSGGSESHESSTTRGAQTHERLVNANTDKTKDWVAPPREVRRSSLKLTAMQHQNCAFDTDFWFTSCQYRANDGLQQ
jgi:hypothetical protein